MAKKLKKKKSINGFTLLVELCVCIIRTGIEIHTKHQQKKKLEIENEQEVIGLA